MSPSDTVARLVRWLILPVAGSLAWLTWLTSPNADPVVLVAEVFTGLAMAAAAVVIGPAALATRTFMLLATAAVAWFLGALIPIAGAAYLGPMTQALVGFPFGRAPGALARAAVVVAWVVWVPAGLAGVDPTPAVLGLAALAVLAPAIPRPRRPRPGWRIGAALTLTLTGNALGLSAAVAADLLTVAQGRSIWALAIGAVAMLIAVAVRFGDWSREAVTQLVIDLGDREPDRTLGAQLAVALDDPTVELAYLAADGTYQDEAGRPFHVPADDPTRAVVTLTTAGSPVGVLVRDARALSDPVLVEGVTAAAELDLANARLADATRRELDQLAASRRRLIDAAEAERERIKTALASRVTRPLLAIQGQLREGGDAQEVAVGDSIDAVVDNLAGLVDGVPVGGLADGDLRDALTRLAVAVPIPVRVTVPDGSWAPDVAAVLWFVASEALANVTKHSQAHTASVTIEGGPRQIALEVLDDGVGGARPEPGSGLAGLRARIEARGGRLFIGDRPGGGTRLRVDLPVGEAVPA